MNLIDSFLSKEVKISIQMSSPLTAETSCSRLSPHISFGTISLRDVYQSTMKSLELESSNDKKISNIIQKPIGLAVILYTSFTINHQLKNMSTSYNGLRENDFNGKYFKSWTEGETGYPLLMHA